MSYKSMETKVEKKNNLYRVDYYTIESDFKEEAIIHVIAEDVVEVLVKLQNRNFQSVGIKSLKEIGQNVKGFI